MIDCQPCPLPLQEVRINMHDHLSKSIRLSATGGNNNVNNKTGSSSSAASMQPPPHHHGGHHRTSSSSFRPQHDDYHAMMQQQQAEHMHFGATPAVAPVVSTTTAQLQQQPQQVLPMPADAQKQLQRLACKKNLQKMLGISPSDIDKYSRIFFPISFICFNLMYWIIYLHVSDEIASDLMLLHP